MAAPLPKPQSIRHEETTGFDLSPELVARLRTRDEAAYAELYRVAFVPLAQFAFGYLGSVEAAEDAVQEVLCRVWRLGPAWTPKGSARTYLYAAVRNMTLNSIRHARVAARHETHVLSSVAADQNLATVPPLEIDVALVDRIKREIAQLSERQRAAFELRYTRDLTVAEVAGVLGVTVKSAEKLLARAVHALRAKLRHLNAE